MPSTYEPIATTTLGSAQASVTFSSLGSYTDLILVFNGKVTSTGGWNFFLQFNGDTGSNYGSTAMWGDGSSAASNRSTNASQCGGYFVDGTNPGNVIVNFMNYRNSNVYKTIIGRGANSGVGADARVSTWRNTAAITSILAYSNGGNFLTGSTFTLYGVLNA
jgi:hypothetical protein